MLLRPGVGFPEPAEEAVEVAVGVQKQIVVVGHHLTDQRIGFVHVGGSAGGDGKEKKREEKDESAIHWRFLPLSFAN